MRELILDNWNLIHDSTTAHPPLVEIRTTHFTDSHPVSQRLCELFQQSSACSRLVVLKEYIASTLVAAMVALSFVSVFGIAPVQAATSLGLDGSASGGAYNRGSYTVTLSTSSSPDVVIAFVTTYVGSSSITVSSISSAHLVFTMRRSGV